MTVYLVTSGCYSDYRVDAAFSSRKIAQNYIDKRLEKDHSYRDSGIEEYEIDALAKSEHFDVWYVRMWLDDGSVIWKNQQSVFEPKYRSRLDNRGGTYSDRPIIDATSSVSEEHAIKIAAEERQRYLREQAQGIEN